MWPSITQFCEAVQNPKICFSDPEFKSGIIAIDKLGMPYANAGQFAVVFKLQVNNQTHAIRCFTKELGDRAKRYDLIDSHLEKYKNTSIDGLQYLAQFEYDPLGVIVGGKKYPVLIMDYIDGYTLDSYIEKMLGNGEALITLASEWVRVIKTLKDSSIAHGDLQHGNIIVQTDSQLKLIDFDGMYVPNMLNFKACELGHINYQHPNRTENDFNLNLDNFSALVIYTSLLVAAYQPNLWRNFHDEGLLFKQRDFRTPQNSVLFRSLNGLNNEIGKYAAILYNSCKNSINNVPSLADLVTVTPKPRLPAWMISTTAPPPIIKTREAYKVEEIKRAEPSVVDNPLTKPIPTHVPTLPKTSPTYTTTVQSVFSFKVFLGKVFLWLLFLFIPWYIMAIIVAAGNQGWFWFHTCCYFFTVLIIAYNKAKIEKIVSQKKTTYSFPRTTKYPPTPQGPKKPVSYPPTLPTYSRGPVTSRATQVVGSRIRNIYHRPSCEWARKISKHNRVYFSSESEAKSRGYHRCRVCFP